MKGSIIRRSGGRGVVAKKKRSSGNIKDSCRSNGSRKNVSTVKPVLETTCIKRPLF